METIRPYMVNLFYKGYISKKKHYMIVKGKKTDIVSDAINEFYGLESNGIEHEIFKNPT